MHTHARATLQVVTGRSANVDVHRMLQQRARRATHAYLDLRHMQQHHHQRATAPHQHLLQQQQQLLGEACILDVTWSRYALPLTRPLTTAPAAAPPQDGSGCCDDSSSSSSSSSRSGAGSGTGDCLVAARHGLLLRVRVRWGGHEGAGVGEVAPLPGLHVESLAEAEAALAVVGGVGGGEKGGKCACRQASAPAGGSCGGLVRARGFAGARVRRRTSLSPSSHLSHVRAAFVWRFAVWCPLLFRPASTPTST